MFWISKKYRRIFTAALLILTVVLLLLSPALFAMHIDNCPVINSNADSCRICNALLKNTLNYKWKNGFWILFFASVVFCSYPLKTRTEEHTGKLFLRMEKMLD